MCCSAMNGLYETFMLYYDDVAPHLVPQHHVHLLSEAAYSHCTIKRKEDQKMLWLQKTNLVYAHVHGPKYASI